MSILEPTLAQKFIDKTAKHLEYNINIMNEKGIIIASKDATRIGDFHEVAFKMLTGTRDTGVVNESGKYLGTKPGVNLFIDYKNEHVGVICVTGDPKNVDAFARLVKLSMETMLEYELHMKRERRRKNRSEQFLEYLLFKEETDLIVANQMAEEFNFDINIIRICIIIRCNINDNPHKMVKSLTKTKKSSYHDLIITSRNDDIILFKSLGENIQVAVKEYKYIVEEYFNEFIQEFSEEYDVSKISFFVGSIQKEIGKYKNSYIHAQELSLQTKGKQGLYFFNDQVLDYYRSFATFRSYDDVFNIYDLILSEEDKNQLIELVDALSQNNYNVVYSAKVLYIHRNTLLFRLNKLKEILNIDPISNAADREFFNELAYYLKRK